MEEQSARALVGEGVKMFDSESSRSASETQHGGGSHEPWQKAYIALVRLGLSTGLTLPTVWFYEAMEIRRLPERERKEDDARFAKRAQMWSLKEFEPQIGKLRELLIKKHGLWLHSLGAGVGKEGRYEIRNADAAGVLVRETVASVTKAIDNARKVLPMMSTGGLSDAAKVAHADAQAKIAHLESLVKISSKRKF